MRTCLARYASKLSLVLDRCGLGVIILLAGRTGRRQILLVVSTGRDISAHGRKYGRETYTLAREHEAGDVCSWPGVCNNSILTLRCSR